MEVLQSNTADNIYFWIEDRVQGNVNPIYESHGAYEIYIVCNGKRRMYLGNVLYKVGTGDALMIPASTPHRSFGDGAFSGICIEFSDAYIKEHFAILQNNGMFQNSAYIAPSRLTPDYPHIFAHCLQQR